MIMETTGYFGSAALDFTTTAMRLSGALCSYPRQPAAPVDGLRRPGPSPGVLST